ncbi:MAG: competence/damage-inducible protein A [Alphaproteobacteria bacterium]
MKKQYKAAMVVIGNEILSGRTHDKNINYVASKLVECGVVLSEVRIVPDEENVIVETVRALKKQVNYVFTSGGIGPTHDDITAECIAKSCGVSLEENKDACSLLLNYYGEEELTAARLRMAQIPVGGTLIPNPVSAAPGFQIENVYVMAGVPRIMQAMMDHVSLTLMGGAVIESRTVECQYPESTIAQELGTVQDLHGNVDIGSYPYFQNGKLGVSIVLRSSDLQALDCAEQAVNLMVSRLS